jgi:hypothetical protein
MRENYGSICGPAQGSPRATISASRFLYKLRGSSQPSIIQGSDSRFYVVKLLGYPGQQGLMNEAVGTELSRRMGLPSPEWARMEISEEFIESHPGLWFLSGAGPIKPRPGLHFASRLIEALGEQRTYQMIPHAWIDRIENRADFLGVLILDLWTNNCDRRQAVYLCDERGRLHASFIDNDFMFGGKFGFETTCPRRAMVCDLEIYRGLWSRRAVKKWLGIIERIREDEIREVVESVPVEWANEKIRLDTMNQLRARRESLSLLVADAENVLNSSYSIKYHRARNATEPGQLLNAPILEASQ